MNHVLCTHSDASLNFHQYCEISLTDLKFESNHFYASADDASLILIQLQTEYNCHSYNYKEA